MITDYLAAQIAGHYLKQAVESGYDNGREIYTMSIAEVLEHLDAVMAEAKHTSAITLAAEFWSISPLYVCPQAADPAASTLEGAANHPCPIAWIDSFAMRNFTNDAVFDDTLPVGDGLAGGWAFECRSTLLGIGDAGLVPAQELS